MMDLIAFAVGALMIVATIGFLVILAGSFRNRD